MKKIIRYLEKSILDDLDHKMVFLAGPRQCGKTTLAKRLLQFETPNDPARYLNWDALEDRELLMMERFPTGPGLLVLDEIHKYGNWSQELKSIAELVRIRLWHPTVKLAASERPNASRSSQPMRSCPSKICLLTQTPSSLPTA